MIHKLNTEKYRELYSEFLLASSAEKTVSTRNIKLVRIAIAPIPLALCLPWKYCPLYRWYWELFITKQAQLLLVIICFGYFDPFRVVRVDISIIFLPLQPMHRCRYRSALIQEQWRKQTQRSWKGGAENITKRRLGYEVLDKWQSSKDSL